MILRLRLRFLMFAFLMVLVSQKAVSQCFQIESILVDACDSGADEGLNEMVRFKVGNAPLNTSTLNVSWPNNSWTGLVQNATTAAKVALLNAQVAAAGGCGQLLEPTAGVLPANAKVILVTSQNFSAATNIFGAITENIYVIFQNNPNVTSGHFANYNATPGIRTLSMNFGACSDTVSYERSLLVNTGGTAGGSALVQNGSTVNFTPAGVATYVNTGCVAPVDIFTVDAGTVASGVCPGSTVSLSGTAAGAASVGWTAAVGSFSSASSLTTTYTLPLNASGTIVLTLSATNSCGSIVTDTVTITVNATQTPTFNAVASICAGGVLSPLPTTSTNGITGSWSPALNNTATTTYTFTPNAGQCATSTTMTINVNQPIVPFFNAVPAICTGTPLQALPTTSTNGITGSWSPALNNTATTIYTFTPAASQCATATTLTVTVNSGNVLPVFNLSSNVCSGAASPLPATSTNGITGSWSPAFNSNATTTYTFTPNAGQCALTTTATIVVNTPVVPTFAIQPAICSGAVLAPLPTTSTNGITGSWSPALNNTATTIYTFTPNAGQCATTASLTIIVNPNVTPVFNPVAPICAGSVLAALPTTSTNGITGSWSPALNNTATTTYTFTPAANQCATTAVLTITVNTGITPLFNAVAPICAGENLAALPTTSLNGVIGIWSPALNNTATTTYTFTPSGSLCATTTTLTITVNSPSTLPVFTGIPAVCTGSFIAPLPTTSLNGITGSWSPALNNMATTTYTFTPDAGQCAAITTMKITVENGFDFEVTGNCTGRNFVYTTNSNSTDLASASFQWMDSNGHVIGTDNSFNVSAYVNSTIATFPMTFSVKVTSAAGCDVTKTVVLQSIYCDIQKGISPNGDTKNEFFDLALLGVKQLSIFNRYGTKVYAKADYTNQWKGQSDAGHELPDGTYYYVIEFKGNVKSKTGWIYINK